MFSIYDIIILTETWLSPDIKDAELGFVGFQVYRLDRNPNNSSFSRGGGVLIAIKSSLESHPVPLNVSNVEQVYALVSININNFLVGCVYLPPVAPLTIVESHLSSVENVLSNLKPHSVFCGDFNIPHINWSSDLLGLSASGDLNPVSHTIVNSFLFHNFFQLNSISNNQGSTLDLIFSNSNKVTVCLATEPLVIPDSYHPPQHIRVPIKAKNKYSNTHTYKDFKSANYYAISSFLSYYNIGKPPFLCIQLMVQRLFSTKHCFNQFNGMFLIRPFILRNSLTGLPLFLRISYYIKKRAHAAYKRSNSPANYSAFSELRAKCKRLSKIYYQS
ncbi:unnamed protein product [Macrosiphum euphorbiae]|nr:unnamed protein product [Macrosiphum euphorbiae]